MKNKVIATNSISIKNDIEMLTADNLEFFTNSLEEWQPDGLSPELDEDVKNFYQDVYESLSLSINYYLKFSNLFFIRDADYKIAGYAVYDLDQEDCTLKVEQWVKNPLFHNNATLTPLQKATALRLLEQLLKIALTHSQQTEETKIVVKADLVTKMSFRFIQRQADNVIEDDVNFSINRSQAVKMLANTQAILTAIAYATDK